MRGEVARGSSPREEQERLNGRKAVVAVLMLVGLALIAAATVLWVLLARACT